MMATMEITKRRLSLIDSRKKKTPQHALKRLQVWVRGKAILMPNESVPMTPSKFAAAQIHPLQMPGMADLVKCSNGGRGRRETARYKRKSRGEVNPAARPNEAR